MIKLVLTRVLLVIPILLGVSLVAFMLMRLVPGDITLTLLGPYATDATRAALREYYGLDRPVVVQYLKWLVNILQGDFGRSIAYQLPVAEILGQRIGNTVVLTVASAGIAIGVGFVGGVLAGVRRYSVFDRVATISALVAASAPTFWISLLLLYLFALKLRWLPATGMYSVGHEGEIANLLWHLPLPAISAALVSLAVVFRLTRSGLLDIMGQDYIRAARARGLPEHRVVRSYAVRMLVPSIVNISGLQVGFIFGASLFAEVIFQWPGVGLLMYNATLARDVPVIQAVLIVFAAVFVLANLVTDLTTAALNPQARHQAADEAAP
ncbi:MAG: ABC transporter permease [Dongiaceae bacterium]